LAGITKNNQNIFTPGTGSDGKGSTTTGFLHCILGIDNKIQEYLLYLPGINTYPGKVGLIVFDYLNAGSGKYVASQFQGIINQCMDIEAGLEGLFLAGKSQQAADDILYPV
jgi:hypothetical protein